MTQENRYRLTTVRHALEYYMENHGFSVESWSDLANMTSVFIEVMGKKQLKDLQPEHFNAYISGRKRGAFGKRKARSVGTMRRELQHLQTAINFCVKAKLVNPEHAPFIPLPEKPQPRDRWLDKKEIEMLKNAAAPESRGDIFLRIVLATGARKRVIETLEWNQVNFATGMISFEKPGAKRTNKKKPTVPMNGDLRLYLEKMHAKRVNNYVLGGTTPINKALDAMAKRAGVLGVTPHVLRHTWASHASMNGVPLGEIARVLGDSIVTVEKVYAKFQPGYLKNAVEQAAL